MSELKLVTIEWADSYGGTRGWQELDALTPDVLICRSVGWLLHETSECVVLVPHIVQPDAATRIATQGRGELTIPKGAIRGVRQLVIMKEFSVPCPTCTERTGCDA